jgi:negative regulator of sigma E activity
MSFDRETIGAFVDGELDEIRRRRIESALRDDPELARQVEAERRLRDALQVRFAPIANEPVPERLVAAVRDGAKVQALPPARRRWVPVAVAASVAALAIAGLQLRPGGDPNIASGTLAQALETQLASAQAADAPVRIGFTFKAQDGAWCRTFEQRAASGIACRSGEGWRVRRTERGAAPTGDYRQAGSPTIAAAAQDMAADAPLDAEAERLLIARAWD